MEIMFILCALIGGTVLVCQLVMTVAGLHSDVELSDDLPTEADFHDGGTGESHHSTWLFGIISFRTVVAALTFFGLAGMAALRADLGAGVALLIGSAAGFAAMLAVHWMMTTLSSLRADGTMRIQRALGRNGSVYIPIPPGRAGVGKVQIHMGDRLSELKAVTSDAKRLETGASVVVVEIINGDTVAVQAVNGAARSASDTESGAVTDTAVKL